MKWKEPTFGPTPLLKALMGANARRKAQAADLEAEQQKLNLTYPDWAKDWIRKYKEAWYMAEACGDKEGMKRAAKLAEGFRDKLRAMEKMPPWAQEQMQKQTVRWMEANEVGNVREMKAAGEAGQGIRDKLIMIDHIGKKSLEDAKRLNDLTAKWYAANDRGIVDGKNMSDKPSEVKKAKDSYSNEAQKLMAQYPLQTPTPKPPAPSHPTPAQPVPVQPPINPKEMKVSKKLVDFVASWESFRPEAYRGKDKQNLTIGYGHVIRPGEDFSNGITQERAINLLMDELNGEYAGYVREWMDNSKVSLSQNQFDAMVSFVYNVGPIGVEMSYSELAMAIVNKASNERLKAEFMDWNKVNGQPVKGLTDRRISEYNIFAEGSYVNHN
ncbi:lysozyme [Paenibacillus oleatilyticus]|uniref:lysozyme n=1 Tax=Paenibacillus oleatilyticus TaxID=2594886 RepID=UPI001C1F52EE|nr:lysozyme [Paenibacillus oleatilyticus]MBU7314287.1 lysozyme [Paenibacillus oleatilyticus]